MSKHVIKDESIVFSIGGKDMEIKPMSCAAEIEHQENLAKLNKKEAGAKALYEAQLKYLSDHGADEKVLRTLSMKAFLDVIDICAGGSKKK